MLSTLTRIQKWTVFTFLFVPLLSSLISTIHIVDFFKIGNYVWMAYVLAAAFEIGSIASAIAITALDKISKWAVWSIFVILVIFQLIGNIFFSFDFVTRMVAQYPDYLDTVRVFLEYFYEFEGSEEFKVVLSILIGMPIPLISLAFLKSVIDYINTILKEESEKLNLEVKDNNHIFANNNQTENKDVMEIEEDVVESGYDEEPEIEDEDQEEVEPLQEDLKNVEVSESHIDPIPSRSEDDYIDVVPGGHLSQEEITELQKKKEYIEKNYNNIQRMKDDLKKIYPSVEGRQYNFKDRD